MEEKRFAIAEALSFGWNTMKANFAFFVMFMLILLTPQIILFVFKMFIAERGTGLYTTIRVIDFFVALLISLALFQVSLRFTAGEKADFTDLYSALPYFWKYLLGFILYVLIIAGGFILLIVPGIIWAVKYQFFGYFIIDQKMTPRRALVRSGQITKGIRGYLLLFDLAVLGIGVLGFLALLIGEVVTVPVVSIAIAYVYRKLLATEIIQPENDELREEEETKDEEQGDVGPILRSMRRSRK